LNSFNSGFSHDERQLTGLIRKSKLRKAAMYLTNQEIDAIINGRIKDYLDAAE
jgi:hypothetical protein